MTTAVAIEIRQLTFAYGDGSNVLHDVSFSVSPGERIALLGPSGAGKSTLLLHLNALLPDPPPSGSDADSAAVLIDGLPATAQNANQIRRRVGLLFQNPEDQLFGSTVGRDVAFGPLNLGLDAGEVQARVERALQEVGLEDFADRDTVRLSLGERKRACLAGVLACQPGCLALDEPFANLDPRGCRRLADILALFTGTLLLATHDLDAVRELADRILVLDDGRLCADGPTTTILQDKQLLTQHGLVA
jgi:energy-coupling factor transporter ATP-binding protein EcfA2